jgi:hypothetical protein
MWLIKGVLTGVVAFLILTVVYVVLNLRGHGAKAIGTTALYAMTVQQPLYWVAFVAVLAVACASFRFVR